MTRQHGFTLIEALAATALTAIMMTAVISVVAAIARHDDTTDTNPTNTDWRRQLTRVITRDLQHADHVQSLDNKLTLTGPVSLDANTFKPTHLPTIVTYEVIQHADQSWLMRTQTDPNSRSLHNAWTQPVCSGVQGLSVVSVPSATQVITPAKRDDDQDQADGISTQETLLIPVDTATLTLIWADTDEPVSTTTLLLR